MDERAVLQGLQSWNSYIWSQTVDICMYRNSTIISRSQRLGYKRTGPSGLAELEQLHVESNSECNRHVYLSYTLANSHLAIILLVSTWPGCSCGRGVCARQLCGYVFLVYIYGHRFGRIPVLLSGLAFNPVHCWISLTGQTCRQTKPIASAPRVIIMYILHPPCVE